MWAGGIVWMNKVQQRQLVTVFQRHRFNGNDKLYEIVFDLSILKPRSKRLFLLS